ncbi:MAG: hypothetical protein A4S09_11755 [Proteobacteria bacterium SG_bin7]|nr:MAG: hypothetical protein A4S09_11755 [Proteobacteria bacterium SG_bin7]
MSNAATKVGPNLLEPARTYQSSVVAPAKDFIFGNVVEVNPLGTNGRVCSFNCPYCDLSQSFLTMNEIRKKLEFPKVQDIGTELRHVLTHWKSTWPTPTAIIVSGNGEPTLHPQIDHLMEEIRTLRDELRPSLPINLYTNAAQLATNKVARATQIADEKLIKIDAGNDTTLKIINAPLVRMGLNKTINAIRKIKDVSIQSIFISGTLSNLEDKQIDDWIEVLGMIGPKKIYLQTTRFQPQDNRVVPATEDQLHLVAQKVERRTGLRPLVFTR